MKTAVSLPDDLFQQAEELARRLHLTRSGLFAAALSDYIRKRCDERITDSINQVCDEVDTTLPADLRQAARRMLKREHW